MGVPKEGYTSGMRPTRNVVIVMLMSLAFGIALAASARFLSMREIERLSRQPIDREGDGITHAEMERNIGEMQALDATAGFPPSTMPSTVNASQP